MEMRCATPLPDTTERLARDIIGCGIRVHRELGPGFLETVYKQAMCLELAASGIPYEREQPVTVSYRGELIGTHRIDLIVAELVVVELKAVPALEAVHCAQVVAYLRATRLRVGLLLNFNAAVLKCGLRRIIL